MTDDPRTLAKRMFSQGWKVPEIAKNLGAALGTVYSWKKRDEWSAVQKIAKVDMAIEDRLAVLVRKPIKTESDFNEMEKLGLLAERTARIARYNDGDGTQADLNPALKKRSKGEKKVKNLLTDEDIAGLREAFFSSIFAYQRVWWDNRHQRNRQIIKSRQIGATWYFAREALIDALETGNNKIFVSASKNQAFIFKQYIQAFVREVTEKEITGTELIILGNNGAELRFLGTNIRTAQGYHGDVYADEAFWIGNFTEFYKVISGMAMHKKWHKTSFSTPSVKNHQAYPHWSGDRYNKGKIDHEKITVDMNDPELHTGKMYDDGVWRNVLTVEDATNGGCDLFDIDELRLEYTDEEFRNLLMCEFIDDSSSVISWDEITAAMVDRMEVWEGFNPFAQRPFGNKKIPVRLGYDPSRSDGGAGDPCSLVVYALPQVEGGKGWVVEKFKWAGMDFDAQVTQIMTIVEKYDVERISIDVTGLGIAVCDILRRLYPNLVHQISYTPESKARMVLIAKQKFSKRLIEFDASWQDMAHALLSIKASSSSTGKHVTYHSARTIEGGHADCAWALLNCLYEDEIVGVDVGSAPVQKSFIRIFNND